MIKKILIIVILGILLMYHGFVVKAEKVKEVRECSAIRDISQEKYNECKSKISYLSLVFKFKEVFQSIN